MPSAPFCDVIGCPNGKGSTHPHTFYHLVPSAEPRRSLWMTALPFRRFDGKKQKVCSLHFRREDYTNDPVLYLSLGVYKRPLLNADAVPSLLGNERQASLQKGEIRQVPWADSRPTKTCADFPKGQHKCPSCTRDMATQAHVCTKSRGVQVTTLVKQTSSRGVQTGVPVSMTLVCHCKRSGRGAWCGSSSR